MSYQESPISIGRRCLDATKRIAAFAAQVNQIHLCTCASPPSRIHSQPPCIPAQCHSTDS
jgi:hypothetical protein